MQRFSKPIHASITNLIRFNVVHCAGKEQSSDTNKEKQKSKLLVATENAIQKG